MVNLQEAIFFEKKPKKNDLRLDFSGLCIIVQVYAQAMFSGKGGVGDFKRFIPVIVGGFTRFLGGENPFYFMVLMICVNRYMYTK